MICARGFRHVGIIVKDMVSSINFYSKFLGLEIIQDFWDDSAYINNITNLTGANVHMVKLRLENGDVLELLEYPTHPTELIPHKVYNVGICHLAVEVADANEAYTTAKSLGYHVLSEPIVSSEGIAKVFFVMDPNNVRVEIVEMIQ